MLSNNIGIMARKSKLLKSVGLHYLLYLIVLMVGLYFSKILLNWMNLLNGFETFDNNSDNELVLIHMKGCGYCVKLMPEWEAAEKENKTDIKMRAVERTQDDGPALCKKHDIRGFPTILLIRNGEKIDSYEGDRSKSGILDFLNKN